MLWSVSVTVAVLAGAQAVFGLLNSTSVIVLNNGFTAYPCLQLNHRLPELEPNMLGLWYVIEIVQHRPENKHVHAHSNPPICPKLTLYQPNNRTVKLTWAEKEGDAVYTFERVDTENPGFWLAYSKTTGSMLNANHRHFAGSTQVIEAQPDHMVLTFCEHSQNQQHFSVVMVRNLTTTVPFDTTASHRHIRDLGLPEDSVRRTCEPGSLWEKGDASHSVLSTALLVMCSLLLISR